MVARNPNGPEGWITTFKDLGGLIAVWDDLDGGNTNIRTKLTASVETMDYDFDTVKFLPTYINNMVSASNSLVTGKANLVSAYTSYLTTVAAPDINSTATTASGVLADMIFSMNGATTGAAPSGVLVISSGHFHTFTIEQYGITMPTTSGSILLTQAESMNLISGTKPSIRRQILDTYGD